MALRVAGPVITLGFGNVVSIAPAEAYGMISIRSADVSARSITTVSLALIAVLGYNEVASVGGNAWWVTMEANIIGVVWVVLLIAGEVASMTLADTRRCCRRVWLVSLLVRVPCEHVSWWVDAS